MSPSPKGYEIKLYMDLALENQVLKSWNVLVRRQINTTLITTASRPHITGGPPCRKTSNLFKTLQISKSWIQIIEATRTSSSSS